VALGLEERTVSSQYATRMNKGTKMFLSDVAISRVDFGVMVPTEEIRVRERAMSHQQDFNFSMRSLSV
jgi:hypothetical protein